MAAIPSIHPQDYTEAILEELSHTLHSLSSRAMGQLVEQILQAEAIFVAGAGRSGLMMRAFAMRLMHLGVRAYVVGETVTPGITANDLLMIGSGSGETSSLISMAAKAKRIGAALAAITINPLSTIAQQADVVIQIHAATKEATDAAATTIQPMGSLFEQTLLLACDSIILEIMARQRANGATMFGRHANLE